MKNQLILSTLYKWILNTHNINLIQCFSSYKRSFWIYKNTTIGITLLPKHLWPFLQICKNTSITCFNQLSEMTAVDYPQNTLRFHIKYILLSLNFNQRIIVTLQVDELFNIKSVTNIFASAVPSEREIWDLFGIFFQEHQNLRRILTDYGFQGYPLRKSFPLTGFEEVNYDLSWRCLKYPNVNLSQELRTLK